MAARTIRIVKRLSTRWRRWKKALQRWHFLPAAPPRWRCFSRSRPETTSIAAEDAYYGTPTLLRTVMANWGLKHTLVNMQDLAAVERAITPATRLIWTETPSNPLLNVTDLRAIVALAKKCGALVACDNTWATPLFQHPLKLGVDVVMHSVTKYLSGHSDVTMGALVFKRPAEITTRVRCWKKSLPFSMKAAPFRLLLNAGSPCAAFRLFLIASAPMLKTRIALPNF